MQIFYASGLVSGAYKISLDLLQNTFITIAPAFRRTKEIDYPVVKGHYADLPRREGAFCFCSLVGPLSFDLPQDGSESDRNG
jgi:hypothetical protein